MFVDTPSEICSLVESKRAATGASKTKRGERRAPIAGGQKRCEPQNEVADRSPFTVPDGTALVVIDPLHDYIANEAAVGRMQPMTILPLASNPIANGHPAGAHHNPPAVSSPIAGHPHTATHIYSAGNPLPHAATTCPHTSTTEPHEEFAPYDPAPVAHIIDRIITAHRLRQGMIKAQTKLKLQAMASIRYAVHEDGDYDSEESKAKARKRADALYRAVESDPTHELHVNIMPYLLALEPLDAQRAAYEKELVKAAKLLPVYEWVKSVKGFGDVSFATIVGECGDIGNYKSVAAVWKRLGLAVIGGKRQGSPGEGATAADWTEHGYNKVRRSVSWNARNNLIGGMGKYRPMFGEDVQANPELTYLQRVFVERARYESEKLGMPVTESDKGKESYKKHPTNRAMRYTEKRLLRELYKAWRR